MNDGPAERSDNTSHATRRPLVVYLVLPSLIASGVGTSAGSYVFFRTQSPAALQAVVRDDAFRGQDATELEAKLRAEFTAEIEHLERDLREHLTRHPDQLGNFDRRLGNLEGRIDLLQDRVNGGR